MRPRALRHPDIRSLSRNVTWYLVAHRSGARVFEDRGDGDIPHCIQAFDRPEGRLKGREIESSRPGRLFSLSSSEKHAVGAHVDARDTLAQEFAKKLASLLHDSRSRQEFDRLVLVAEPRFLGRLRGAMDEATLKYVAGTSATELWDFEAPDLPQKLLELKLG